MRRYPYRTSQQSCRRAERIPGIRFYRLPRRSKERPADRAREARTECARYHSRQIFLAPEGKPVAFCLDPETGFSWIGEYDITADELLSGAGGNNATKTEQAEKLILDLLADGKELASEDIVKAAAEAGISERTVQNAKRNMGGILGARRVGGQWYNFIKRKQPPEPAS